MPDFMPTDAELSILGVLWSRGPSTVREVFEVLNKTRETGYTTVLKLMQLMNDKGLAKRDERSRSHIYRAAIDETRTQRRLLKDLLARAFGGSKEKLLLGALDATRATPAQLDAVKQLFTESKRAG